MNTADRLAIEWECTRLISLYAALNDAARWDDVAALYTDDGVMARPAAPDQLIIGRTAILASLTGRPPRISRHICSNIIVDVKNDTEASAQSTILLFTGKQGPDGGLPIRDDKPPLVGSYHDRFRLTPLGWRFADRRGSMVFG
jgi:SnoaL-like domain